jgi:hypothetical protein
MADFLPETYSRSLIFVPSHESERRSSKLKEENDRNAWMLTDPGELGLEVGEMLGVGDAEVGLVGRAPAPPKTAPALAPLVGWLLWWS